MKIDKRSEFEVLKQINVKLQYQYRDFIDYVIERFVYKNLDKALLYIKQALLYTITNIDNIVDDRALLSIFEGHLLANYYDLLYTLYQDENITKRISIEILAQLIYSKMGNPDRATNQKKALFDKYYDEIFSENLNFEEVKDLVEKYFNIQERYKESNFEMTNQKCFYILWISEIYDKLIDQSIQLLEKYLLEYKKEENISNSRKLIQKGFKKYIEDNIKNIF